MTLEFTVFSGGHGVPDDIDDFDPALAPPLGAYGALKALLALVFEDLAWDDSVQTGRVVTADGVVTFDCSDILLETNLFSISASLGTDVSEALEYLEPRLKAAGLVAIDQQTLQFIGDT